MYRRELLVGCRFLTFLFPAPRLQHRICSTGVEYGMFASISTLFNTPLAGRRGVDWTISRFLHPARPVLGQLLGVEIRRFLVFYILLTLIEVPTWGGILLTSCFLHLSRPPWSSERRLLYKTAKNQPEAERLRLRNCGL